MSNKNCVTNLTETDVITELQKSNKELRDQLQKIEFYLDGITAIRIYDLRNLLRILPTVRRDKAHCSILNAMHTILDELYYDVKLIIEDGMDELNERYDDRDKVLRGGETF